MLFSFYCIDKSIARHFFTDCLQIETINCGKAGNYVIKNIVFTT